MRDICGRGYSLGVTWLSNLVLHRIETGRFLMRASTADSTSGSACLPICLRVMALIDSTIACSLMLPTRTCRGRKEWSSSHFEGNIVHLAFCLPPVLANVHIFIFWLLLCLNPSSSLTWRPVRRSLLTWRNALMMLFVGCMADLASSNLGRYRS